MSHERVATNGAPAPVGPYSQGIVAGDLVFCAGQLGLDPLSGELPAGVEAQAKRALENLAAVVKTTIFLADIGDFAAVNGIYATFVADPPPARSTFAVGSLPKGGLVEVEAIALRHPR